MLLLGFGPGVRAVTISPVMLELSPLKRVASVRVHNDSDEAMIFQADTLAWQQVDGEDRYTETQELLVAPPMAEIAPGASQIFRVTLRQPATTGHERSYRLLLEDVTEETATGPGAVKFRFRHNLPLFVSPPGTNRSDPRWSRCAAPAGKACVRLDNEGNRHLRLTTLKVEGEGWSQEIKGGGTVLAGAWRQWLVEPGSARALPLRVMTAAGNGEALQAFELAGPTP
ncbi:MAG: molecular chaperone [Bacteroidota bacterium]